MQALFSENVSENERIGSHRGRRAPGTRPLDLPMEALKLLKCITHQMTNYEAILGFNESLLYSSFICTLLI